MTRSRKVLNGILGGGVGPFVPLFVILLFTFSGVAPDAASSPASLLEDQLRFSRVRDAAREKKQDAVTLFASKGMQFPPYQVFLRALKAERELELWARPSKDAKFVLIKTYPFCSTSGRLGPKRAQGDLQIPEGVYEISEFNPVSSFHLSMRVNYPNQADRMLGGKDPGGDIFIHGNCVTIGCIPITDDLIKELYFIVLTSHGTHAAPVPVHIFPYRMTPENVALYGKRHAAEAGALQLWKQLAPIFLAFDSSHVLPSVRVDRTGAYELALPNAGD